MSFVFKGHIFQRHGFIGRYLGQEKTKVIAVTNIESFFKKSIGKPF